MTPPSGTPTTTWAVAERADADGVGAHLGRLDREHDNMRSALSWLVQSADAERSQRLATALAELWSTRGDFEEGQYWFGAVLALPGWRSSLLRARALNAAGRLAWNTKTRLHLTGEKYG